MKKTAGLLLLSLTTLILTLSCSKEEKIAPFVKEFVNAYTDPHGFISVISNDRGNRYVTSDTVRLEADSTYRLIMSYCVNEDTFSATILDYASVLSSPARKADREDTCSDPVDIRSAWLGGGWLNLIIELKGLEKKHRLYAVENSDSTRVAFSLFHDADDDISSYTAIAYMSIPLEQYADVLSVNDTITLSYTDYSGSVRTRTFTTK
mgnify:CR=1 FL=1